MRPKIICHMMSSVDGRLIADRWSLPFDGKNRESLYEPYFELSLAQNADALIVGRKTIQADYPTQTFDYINYKPAKEFKTFIGNRESERACIVLDPKGKIIYEGSTLDGDDIIAILGEEVSEDYLSLLRAKGISYLFAGRDGQDVEKALEVLFHEFEIKKILLSGGSIINGKFLKAKLIDELILMIYPGIDALSDMPSIFEYVGKDGELPAEGQFLEFVSSEIMRDGIVTLYYKFHKS